MAKDGKHVIHAGGEATGLKLGLAYGGDGYDKQLKVLESG